MAPLKNPQDEKYAVERASGKKAIEAYRLAGFRPHRGNAARFERYRHIAARVAELQREAAELAGLSLARVLIEYGRIALADVTAFYENDGLTLRNIKSLPPELRSVFAGMKFDSEGRIELKTNDKQTALAVIYRHLAGQPAEERAPDVNILNVLSLDGQRALAEALEALGGGRGDAGGGTPP
jgi:phage terminase small subunit